MVAEGKKTTQVFISHALSDVAVARAIAAELDKAGFDAWFLDSVLPADNILLELGKALEESDAMVVLVSPEAVKSSNLNFELGYALGASRFRQRVIPVIVRPTKQVPWILAQFQSLKLDKNPASTGRRVAKRLRQLTEG
jgi:hypothetical protein